MSNTNTNNSGELSITLGRTIKSHRISHCMTKSDLARKLNVTYITIYYWENDSSKPSLHRLRELADLFSINIEELTKFYF